MLLRLKSLLDLSLLSAEHEKGQGGQQIMAA